MDLFNIWCSMITPHFTSIHVTNRGNCKPEEKWFLNGNHIELCNEFMYLGILFYFNGNFVQIQKILSDQGRKAVLATLQYTIFSIQ
jgi:hypothetical protein